MTLPPCAHTHAVLSHLETFRPTQVIRKAVVNGVAIELERGNIVDCRAEALVNAANSLSFTRMDCGVS